VPAEPQSTRASRLESGEDETERGLIAGAGHAARMVVPGGVLLCAGGPDTSPTQQRSGGVAMTPATPGVIDAACSVRRRSISVQAAAGGSRRAALVVRPFVSRATSRVAHIAPPVTRGRPLRPSRGSLAASSLRVTRREASLAARQARPARAPLQHHGWRTDTPDGSSWQEAAARPALPRRVSAVRDRAPLRSHRPVRRTVTSLRRDSAPAFASLSAHTGALLRLLITACQSTSRTSRPSAAAGARLMRQ